MKDTIKCWVELYSDNLYSWALHKTSSKEVAEDLVQETFMAAVQSFGKFEEKSNPKTWLFAILNNKINDHHRNNFRRPTINEETFLNKFFDQNEDWKAEERPDNWFSAVQLKYLEEKNGELICQELGITPTNFWQILHRAKLQLRKCLETNWFKK
jgi:RNA polymerase sigma factor (sigma-70 family)